MDLAPTLVTNIDLRYLKGTGEDSLKALRQLETIKEFHIFDSLVASHIRLYLYLLRRTCHSCLELRIVLHLYAFAKAHLNSLFIVLPLIFF